MRVVYVMLVATLILTGCDVPSPPAASPVVVSVSEPPRGTIRGRVTWAGPIPAAESWTAERWQPGPDGQPGRAAVVVRPNVLVPKVDPATRGVAGAVVYLAAAPVGPSPYPAVRATIHDGQPLFGDRNVALVPVGGTIRFQSTQALPHAVRARGADLFAFTLPAENDGREQPFGKPGLVEIGSGAGHYWMRGFVWVCSHPHYTITDAEGRYELPGVPAGRYELRCWHHHWQSAKQDRDGETTVVTRMTLKPALERGATVAVAAGGSTDQSFEFRIPPPE